MTDSLNNKELVAVGHQFAKAMSSDKPIIDMAKIVSRLAERLDCTTAALREMTKERNALAAREVKLAKHSVAEVMLMSGFDRQYAEGWCAGNDNAIHEIHVAGIRINGEG